MAGLQRSSISFRRQGSSGIVWDDRFLSGELNKPKEEETQRQDQGKTTPESLEQGEGIVDDINAGLKPIRTVGSAGKIERNRSNGGGRRHRTGRVSPAMDPPSPRLSACGCCSAFGSKPAAKKVNDPRKRTGKRKSR